jgi:hypothetical protein
MPQQFNRFLFCEDTLDTEIAAADFLPVAICQRDTICAGMFKAERAQQEDNEDGCATHFRA